MKNSIVLLIALSLANAASGQTFVKKDTLRFASDSCYSRAIIRTGSKLILGTSNGLILSYNEKNRKTELITAATVPSGLSLKKIDGEFRAVEKSGSRIIGMISGNDGYIITSTKNKTFTYVQPGVFMDDIDFCGRKYVVLGDRDTVTNKFYLKKFGPRNLVSSINTPEPIEDEACYAASASTVLFPSRKKIMFISGGKSAVRFHKTENLGKTWDSVNLPMPEGEGCGPFSIHFTDKNHGMIVGGCYTKPNNSENSSLYTTDGGKTWNVSEKTTNGYRSCVTGNSKIQFACGTNGIDVSTDGGKTWEKFDSGNFCALLLENSHLYATTNKGYVIRYRIVK